MNETRYCDFGGEIHDYGMLGLCIRCGKIEPRLGHTDPRITLEGIAAMELPDPTPIDRVSAEMLVRELVLAVTEDAHARRMPGDRAVAAHDAVLAAIRAPQAEMDAIVRTLNLEPTDDGDGWWLPAEPGPVECRTIAEAVAEAERLSNNDGRRAEATERALRTELAELTSALAATRRELSGLRPGLDKPHPHRGVQREKVDAALEMADAALHAARAEREEAPNG